MQSNSIDLFSNRKICRRCGQDKPLDQFETYDNGAGPRHRGTCRVCQRIRAPKTPGMKECFACGETKPLEEYYLHRNTKNRKQYPSSYCKTCANQRRIDYAYRPASKKVVRRMHLKADFGLTIEQYDSLFQAQDGKCAVCGKPETRLNPDGTLRRLAVDHCHFTKKIRGLCCAHCNCGLGHFMDDPELMEAAAKYIRSRTELFYEG